MKLSEAAHLLSGQLQGHDAEFNTLSTDTRSIKQGDLFLALNGPNFDGHKFIARAQEQHAVAAIVEHQVESALPTIIVNDTLHALGTLGQHWREQLNIPVIGVTGSCGKTTTKRFITSILIECGKVHATQGTLNNDIGVPLTLMQLQGDEDFAVIELGANHPGEIATVSAMAKPTVGLITNAAASHLEGFGDLNGVSRAKGELFQALPDNGVAIINADDQFADFWKSLLDKQKIITFSSQRQADITASHIEMSPSGFAEFTLHTPVGDAQIKLGILGRHNVSNALAAAAAALAVDAPLAAIRAGLENARPESKRLVVGKTKQGAVLIDDSYNANPTSTKMAVDILAAYPGEKFFVLGDMLELGDDAKKFHHELGEELRASGIQHLYALGDLTQETVNGFGPQGRHFSEQAALIDALQQQNLSANCTVLVKGSRSMKMENVVTALK